MKARFFRDFHGSTAAIRQYAGKFRLTVFFGIRRYHNKVYSSYRGARIALGKLGDCWTEVQV